jgi:hypothetical protein
LLFGFGEASRYGVFGNVGGGGLDLEFLLEGWVGGEEVRGSSVNEVLLVVLFDGGGKRGEDGEDVVGDGEGDLFFGLEGLGEVDGVVLCWSVVISLLSVSRVARRTLKTLQRPTQRTMLPC